MHGKGIGPQGLGVKTNNGYTIGKANSPVKQESPLMLKDACYKKVKASYKVFPLLTPVVLLLNVERNHNDNP